MHALFLVSVWIHILAAATWIGGSLFLTLVLVPVVRRPEWRSQGTEVIRPAARRFKGIVWTCFALLIATGVANVVLRGAYGRLLWWKLALVAAILALSAFHDFVLGPRRMVLAARWIGRLNLFLGILVIGLGVTLARGWLW